MTLEKLLSSFTWICRPVVYLQWPFSAERSHRVLETLLWKSRTEFICVW